MIAKQISDVFVFGFVEHPKEPFTNFFSEFFPNISEFVRETAANFSEWNIVTTGLYWAAGSNVAQVNLLLAASRSFSCS